MKVKEENHAVENARCWLGAIMELAERLSVAVDTDDEKARERVEIEIEESILSVQVRSGWELPGAKFVAEEYEILLTMGGPALRMIGSLDDYGQPFTARLEWQDWGTPWTEFRLSGLQEKSCLIFARQFYFGEG